MKKSVRNSESGAFHGAHLALDDSLFSAGERVCVAVSGGADSVALLRALHSRRGDLGIVLSVVHVEHGLRGDAAKADAQFVAELAEKLCLPCETVSVDTPKRAAEHKETIEEAARNLRYQVFRELLEVGKTDKIATAHTLDDQAETVLMKLLRGAWTEGLSGIHPALRLRDRSLLGVARDNFDCVRPLLGVRRSEIESYLRVLDQPWREDETNRSVAYTRNRVRHELLPQLRDYNPEIEEMLAHVAANARAEEKHWQTELERVLPHVLLPGKPVRGGGRSVATVPNASTVAVDLARFNALDEGLQRRVLRAAARSVGAAPDLQATEHLLEMAGLKANGQRKSPAPKRLDLPGGIRVERSARELQFTRRSAVETAESGQSLGSHSPSPEYQLPVPGSVDALSFGSRFVATLTTPEGELFAPSSEAVFPPAIVRCWQPGDRVDLRHSAGSKKVKEVLEKIGLRGEERRRWPVVVWGEEIVWMRGVEVLSPKEDSPRPAHAPKPPVLRVTETGLVTDLTP